MSAGTAARLSEFLSAIHSTEPVRGFTHTYYRYPACFSPQFARSAIRAFTRKGDTILDPFMGGGTTLVEAVACGRKAIGCDVNSLAQFVATLKTTTLSENDLRAVADWADSLAEYLNIHAPARRDREWCEAGYQRHLPWRHRKIIELVLDRIDELPRYRQQRFARGILLRISQWALDCRQRIPSINQFRNQFFSCFEHFAGGMREFREAVFSNRLPNGCKPRAICLHGKAADLPNGNPFSLLPAKPKLVVTSPPYPGVYVLYHRWKVRGRKETPAPYWLADCRDGRGQTHYCFGDRRKEGLTDYFDGIRESFAGVRKVIDPSALVVQLVSFKQPDWQIPAYLSAMQSAGFSEVLPNDLGIAVEGRLWREVPGRRWFALIQGELNTSREVVLFHRPATN